MKYIYCIVLIFVLIGCDKNRSHMEEVLNVDFTNIDYVSLNEDTLKVDAEITGNVYIKDSIMLMYSKRYKSHLFQAFNIKNGNNITSLLPVGQSQNEYLPNTRIYFDCHQISNNEWGIWTFDRSRGQYRLVNITRSITEGSTIVNTTVKFNNLKNGFRNAFGRVFFYDYDKQAYARMQEYKIGNEKICQPIKYFKCEVINDELQVNDEINIYNKGISEDDNMHALASRDIYDNEKGKIAMAMEFLPQLNIIDTKNGTVKGFCYKEYSAFETILENRKNDLWYNISVASNDKFIYVLTTEGNEGLYPASGNIIYVFDWDGKPVSRLKTTSLLYSIIVDNDMLYAQDVDYNCFKYKLN